MLKLDYLLIFPLLPYLLHFQEIPDSSQLQTRKREYDAGKKRNLDQGMNLFA